jgi:heptosyltransferase III
LIRRLIVRPGAIGDFIVSLPAMESLRSDYTEVWCAGQNVPIARFADSARSIVAVGLDRLGLVNDADVVARLRGFDSIISWYGANRPEFQDLTRGLGLPIRFLPALPDGNTHAIDFYNDQARSLGGREPSRFPALPWLPDHPATPEFAVLHPFASGARKRAPMNWFQSAAERLSRNMPVHWLCGPEETLAGAVRIDDLYELACWLRKARIFVGNDSGISHLAAAAGTSVLAWFGPTDPRVWAPRGPAVHVVHAGSAQTR